jgi:hypothetical protein
LKLEKMSNLFLSLSFVRGTSNDYRLKPRLQ